MTALGNEAHPYYSFDLSNQLVEKAFQLPDGQK